MVIPIARAWTDTKVLVQWSSLGQPVHLIDQNEKQLEKAQSYIQELRKSGSPSAQGWGKINTFTPSRLKEAVSPSWMVIEVHIYQ